ncbi:MAG: DUF4249 domain-containing protein [Bacteroidales bacterium]|nr:DUF4249 domain-containing protein [Bacteroidales bacterium]
MKKITFITIIIITLVSCRKDFYYNFETQPQINVSCFLQANDTVKIQLTYLLGDVLVNNVLPDKDYITDAKVFLYEDQIFREQLQYREIPLNIGVEKGWYFTNTFIPKENHSYQLKIVKSGFDTVYAETYIPQSVKIDSIKINGTKITDTVYLQNNTLCSADIYFKDKSGQRNYYNYWSNTYFKSYDPVIESRYNSGYYITSTLRIAKFAFFSDDIIDGKNYALNTTFNNNFGTDIMKEYSIQYKLFSLSYDTYAFYKSWYLYFKTLDNPLSEPVIIYSNIKNGTGIFAGMSASTDSVKVIINFD